MTCFHPREAWPPASGAATRKFVFSASKSYVGAVSIQLPCGRCQGCRRTRAGDWSVRIKHEASLYESNVFITATHDDAHLPDDLSISVRTHQLFVKRARKELGPLRFFGVGEYGDINLRPHYHSIFFGIDFPDKVLWSKGKSGELLYRSETLDRIWGQGLVLFGTVTEQSANYVARYTFKKIGGDMAEEHYRRSALDPATGEIASWSVREEFAVMSRRPGIGSGWYDQFSGDAFPSDFVIIDGAKRPVPRFYKTRLAAAAPLVDLKLSAERKSNVRAQADNNTPERLAVREEVQRRRADRLFRDLDVEGDGSPTVAGGKIVLRGRG